MKEVVFGRNNDRMIPILRKLKKFDMFSDEDLLTFQQLARVRECMAGEVLIREGDYDSSVYFLILGVLEIVKGDKVIGTLDRSGDIFGEMGVIDGSPRSASVRALENSLVLGLDAALLDRKMKINEVFFSYSLYRLFSEVLAKRLRETTEENTRLRREISELKKKALKHKPLPVSPCVCQSSCIKFFAK